MTFLNYKNEDITSKLRDYDMKYDPKIGLIFKKVRKSDVYKIGTLTWIISELFCLQSFMVCKQN